jgi:microcystin-dependent protein
MLSLNSTAQIGIGTDNPSAKAVLHLESSDKGLIIPKMSNATMDAMTVGGSIETGTLVFNTDVNEIFCYKNGKWYSITPFHRKRESNITRDSILPATSSAGNPLNVKKINSDTVNAFTGLGITPIGGIIMWSGTTIPYGWALCNGQTANGHPTPDLSGRFVVGYSATQTSYNMPGFYSQHALYKASGGIATPVYTPGNTGGQESVTLTVTTMPAHNHGGNTATEGAHTHNYMDRYEFENNSHTGPWGEVYVHPSLRVNNNGNSGGDGDNDSFFYIDGVSYAGSAHLHGINSEGGGQPHENRPPYYTLAYIMRVK